MVSFKLFFYFLHYKKYKFQRCFNLNAAGAVCYFNYYSLSFEVYTAKFLFLRTQWFFYFSSLNQTIFKLNTDLYLSEFSHSVIQSFSHSFNKKGRNRSPTLFNQSFMWITERFYSPMLHEFLLRFLRTTQDYRVAFVSPHHVLVRF